MASFTAFLEVGGRTYPLYRYELSMHQETDTLGRPASPVLGGTLTCTLASPGSADPFLYQWAMSPTMQHDGKIRLLQAEVKATEKTISFFNAYCTGLDLSFVPGQDRGGGDKVLSASLIQVQISPQRIAVGAIVHDNNWPLASHGSGESFAKQPPTPSDGQAKREETPSEPSGFMEGLHGVLDVVGMIPVIGEVADATNAAVYLGEGRYGEAAMSAASMIPLAGNAVGATNLLRKSAKVIAKAREFKQVKRLWESGADLMEKGAGWVGKVQRGSTGFLGSPRLSRRELQAFKKQARELGAELEIVKDKAMLKFMDSKKAQAGFMASVNKLFVRKGATRYEVVHEMTHAKHCKELGREAYEKLNRLEKETHVFEQLMKQSNKLTGSEIKHATEYINNVRKEFGIKISNS